MANNSMNLKGRGGGGRKKKCPFDWGFEKKLKQKPEKLKKNKTTENLIFFHLIFSSIVFFSAILFNQKKECS